MTLLRSSWPWFVLGAAGALVLLFFMQSFQTFIDFVTITAFIVAPITAILNHIVITSEDVAPALRPGPTVTAMESSRNFDSLGLGFCLFVWEVLGVAGLCSG